MGQAIDFPDRNDWIGKPHDMSNHQCYALPVCRFITHIPGIIPTAPPEKTLAHASFWSMSDEEIEEIVKNRGVWVKIIGTTLAPMSVHGNKPIYPGEGNLSDHIFTEEELNRLKQKGV